jgi:membrane carboxypeptidase/penicillin-binding protein
MVRHTPEIGRGGGSTSGVRSALRVVHRSPPWCDIVREYASSRPRPAFARPEGISTATICVDSGRLATPYCTHVQAETFGAKTRPRNECDLHTVAGIDGDSEAEMRSLEGSAPEELAPPPPAPPDQR